MKRKWAAILPSRDEASTIAGVAQAVDGAMESVDGVIVNVDHSAGTQTRHAFEGVSLRAKRRYVKAVRGGKGAQVLRGLAEVPNADSVLVIDTDTRNPAPDRFGALMSAVDSGADLAVADYQRHWYEANLTNHLARPLIAATIGLDLGQPLAGDLALSARAVFNLLGQYQTFANSSLKGAVDGYGIDSFIVISCALAQHDVRSVPLPGVKLHAPSFPHLPRIYREAAPVLLAMTGAIKVLGQARAPLQYLLSPTMLDPIVLRTMLASLSELRRQSTCDAKVESWPEALTDAWSGVRAGGDPVNASDRLWPAYLDRVMEYLTLGSTAGLVAASATLVDASHDIVCRVQASRSVLWSPSNLL